MDISIGLNIMAWSDAWFSMPLSERKDLLNKNDWKAKGYHKSKRWVLCNILTDAHRAKKEEVVEDIYNSILGIGYRDDNALDHYEYSLLWIESELTEGQLPDEYTIQMALGNYYKEEKKDYPKAIEYYKKTCIKWRSYQEAAIAIDPNSKFSYYINPAYLLVLTLIDDKQFDESRKWEQYMIEKGYYSKDDSHIEMIHIMRISGEVGALSEAGQVLTNLDDIKAFEEANKPDYAANYYKMVANQYYKLGDYKNAKDLYAKAYALNPNIAGVESKLKAVNKKLGTQE